MGRINVLGFDVANLIAAGEVVDRPSSVVKELLENSIDAGADSVTVEIQNGGVSFIRISDNGCGMDAEDLPVAILRHATSKIQNAGDLSKIETLGFRGEALAAISSVSKMRIFSKPKGADMGAILESEAGNVIDISEVGCADGTTIVVEDLFYNVPARRKFLKRDATEATAVGAVVEKIALSKPELAVKYICDGSVKFMTVGNGELKQTVYSIFGKETAARSLEVSRVENGITVTGYVGEPDMFKSNRNMENIFVNGRYVKSRTAMAAVEQAYKSKIPSDKFPFCVLNIAINPSAVDVNVHPAKLEVKFSNEKIIFDSVYYAVLSALEAQAIRPELKLNGPQKESLNTLYQDKDLPLNRQTSNKAGISYKSESSPFWVDSKQAKKLMGAFVPADTPRARAEQIKIDAKSGEDYSGNVKNDVFAVQMQTPYPVADGAESQVFGTSAQDFVSNESAMEETKYAELSDNQNVQAYAKTDSYTVSAADISAVDHTVRGTVCNATDSSVDSSVGNSASNYADKSDNNNILNNDVGNDVEDYQDGYSNSFSGEQTDKIADDKFDEEIPRKHETASEAREPAPEYIILGEAYNCYVIVQLEDRLLFVDKHAAHERILFDELCRNSRNAAKNAQILLCPIVFDITASEYDSVCDYENEIKSLGFEFTAESATSLVAISLTQIPEMLNANEAGELFRDLAAKLSDGAASVESASAEFFESRLFQSACKAAIKGGRIYNIEHIKWICDRLIVNPGKDGSVIRTCPHGRPVAFEIKRSSIDRQFGRLG